MATYKLITSYTSTGENIITLSSIPQTYTDLVIKFSSKGSANNQYDLVRVYVNGTSDNAGGAVHMGFPTYSADYNFMNAAYTTDAANGANVFGPIEYYLPNYAKPSVQKSFLLLGGAEQQTSSIQNFLGGILTTQTGAITSLSFDGEYGSFLNNTTIYLYGILAS
jgi:hypothetical protein